MYTAGSHQSNHNSSAGASSSSTSVSNISRPDPSPPMTPGRQQATPSPLVLQPSTPAHSLVVRGRNRELQQLNNEIQLLQEELSSLDSIPPASRACQDLVAFVENRPDPFFPVSDGVGSQSWPYDRPVKASRCCWKF